MKITIILRNEDKYKKRGRPFKSLLEQVLENESLSLDRLRNNAMMKKICDIFYMELTWVSVK